MFLIKKLNKTKLQFYSHDIMTFSQNIATFFSKSLTSFFPSSDPNTLSYRLLQATSKAKKQKPKKKL